MYQKLLELVLLDIHEVCSLNVFLGCRPFTMILIKLRFFSMLMHKIDIGIDIRFLDKLCSIPDGFVASRLAVVKYFICVYMYMVLIMLLWRWWRLI